MGFLKTKFPPLLIKSKTLRGKGDSNAMLNKTLNTKPWSFEFVQDLVLLGRIDFRISPSLGLVQVFHKRVYLLLVPPNIARHLLDGHTHRH